MYRTAEMATPPRPAHRQSASWTGATHRHVSALNLPPPETLTGRDRLTVAASELLELGLESYNDKFVPMQLATLGYDSDSDSELAKEVVQEAVIEAKLHHAWQCKKERDREAALAAEAAWQAQSPIVLRRQAVTPEWTAESSVTEDEVDEYGFEDHGLGVEAVFVKRGDPKKKMRRKRKVSCEW